MPGSRPSGRISAATLRAALRAHADPGRAAGAQRYFVDGVKTYGTPREILHRLARRTAATLKAAPGGKTGAGLTRALTMGDGLFRSGNLDEALVATRIVARFSRELTPAHVSRFDRWVDSLRDWASCDTLCGELIGPLVRNHPQLISRIAPWTRSQHRWRRRAAAVAVISLARTGERLPAILGIADRLLRDDDLMVQKGVGWLLKEATRRRAPAIVAYLVANRTNTTRLVLRYACEKLPEAQRRRVLAS